MFAPFFSLSFPCSTNSITSPLLIFFFFLRCTQTHPHRNTSTQTNQHRDTLAQKKKKKKNTEIHKHTHIQTNPNRQTTKRQIGAYRNDRCLTGTIRARGYRSCLIRAREISNLIGACGSKLGRSVLVGRCLIGSCLIGAGNQCLWSRWCGLDREGELICVGYRERATDKKKKGRERECAHM